MMLQKVVSEHETHHIDTHFKKGVLHFLSVLLLSFTSIRFICPSGQKNGLKRF